MRILLIMVVLISSAALKAQTFLPLSFTDYTQQHSFADKGQLKDSGQTKKWFLSTYSSISTSFSFFGGGNAAVVSAPLGLQLNRRLNNNLYAFAGVSVAPAYVNFCNSFLSANVNKGLQSNNYLKSGGFGMYSRAEMGLMYINDQRTFSISGSISVERSSYPVYQYNQMNTVRPIPVIVPN